MKPISTVFDEELKIIVENLVEEASTHMLNMKLAPELTSELIMNAEARAVSALKTLLLRAKIDEILMMRAVGDKYATGGDVSFEGLAGAYDAHILKRAADLTEDTNG